MARRSSGGHVEIEGARMLRASLKAAGHGLEDLKIANRNAAKTVEKQAVATAPVSKRKGHVPGRLKASVRSSGTTRAGIIRAGKKAVPYANPIHWGWKARGIKARPWVSIAAQTTEEIWVTNYMAELRAAVAKVKGK